MDAHSWVVLASMHHNEIIGIAAREFFPLVSSFHSSFLSLFVTQLTFSFSWKWNEHLVFPLPRRVLFLLAFISFSLILVRILIRSYSRSHFYIIRTNILLSRYQRTNCA